MTGQFIRPPPEFWSLPFGKPGFLRALSPCPCTPPELGACAQFDWSLTLHPGWCVFGQNGYRSTGVMLADLQRPDFRWHDFKTMPPRWQACAP